MSAATGIALTTNVQVMGAISRRRRTAFCHDVPARTAATMTATAAASTTIQAIRRKRGAGSHFVSRRTTHAANTPIA